MNGAKQAVHRDTEQLIVDFAETTHVPTTYINKSLSAVGTHTQISDAVQSLLADLEFASSKAAAKLDSLVDDLLRTAPRLGYDVEVLRGDLQRFHTTLQEVEPKRQALSGKGEVAIKKLAMLEIVKQQMQETQTVYQLAKKWSPPESIEDPIIALISAKEYSAALKQVLHYEGLLQVYRGTSEYARRKSVIDRIRKKLTTDGKQDVIGRAGLESVRASMDSQRSQDSSNIGEEGYYSSFIKRAFKT